MVKIEINKISKKYNISLKNTNYLILRDVFLLRFFGFFKKTESNRPDFLALKDIDLIIEQGVALGIIGRNGAGKSTLLKIISRVTSPSSGNIKIKGKVVSLLEVGSGFHPELTGRENIYINGAILGMTKKEIEAKMPEIINFSGVGDFLNIPIKYYSSGMAIRLAFSVLVFMDTDILIIDEALTVGDIEFQKKCFDKINQISKTKGKIIILVSHNLSTIEKFCNKCLYLEKGEVKYFGEVPSAINMYKKDIVAKSHKHEVEGLKVNYFIESNKSGLWDTNDFLVINIIYKQSKEIGCWSCDIAGYTVDDVKIFAIESERLKFKKVSNYNQMVIRIKNPGFSINEIRLDIALKKSGGHYYDILLEDYARIQIGKKNISDYYRDDVLLALEAECEVL